MYVQHFVSGLNDAAPGATWPHIAQSSHVARASPGIGPSTICDSHAVCIGVRGEDIARQSTRSRRARVVYCFCLNGVLIGAPPSTHVVVTPPLT